LLKRFFSIPISNILRCNHILTVADDSDLVAQCQRLVSSIKRSYRDR